jgi:TetR/AcrR family transcriptional repressor of bet genes
MMPKRVDIDSQRRRLAQAAVAVIHQGGLEGARLRDVARAADVTTGAVMHYFDDKDAVLEAALEEVVRRTLERMEGTVPPESRADPEAFIRRVGRYLPLRDESRAEWRVWLAFWGRAMSEERLRAVHRKYYGEIIDRLVERLRGLRTSPPAPSLAQLRRCADAVLAAIDGVGSRATLEPEGWPARRQRETLGALLRPLLGEFIRGADLAATPGQARRKETR